MYPACRSLLVFVLSAVFLYPCSSQSVEPNPSRPIRVEIPAKSTDETYKVVPCGATGMVLFFKSLENVGDSATKWYFSFYDKDLHQIWTKSIPVEMKMVCQQCGFENDTISMLFLNTGKEKEGRGKFSIVRLLTETGTFIANRGNLPPDAEDIDFKVVQQNSYICYNQKNEPAHLQVMNLNTGRTGTFPWSRGVTSKVLGFTVDPVNRRVRASLSQLSQAKIKLNNFLVSMDMNGKVLAEIPILPVLPNRHLRRLDFLPADSNNWLIFGSYGATPLKSSSQTKKIEESSGFFSCKLGDGQLSDINFINLLELNCSKELLGERDIMALKKKALRKNRNISEYSLDYPMLLQKVFRHNDQFILIAESYSPQYHSESYTDFDFYGRPYVNTYDVFDGYRYYNGIITAYDKDGKLLWDNVMEIRNLLTYELVPRITAFFTKDDETVLAYLSEGKIASKIIKGNEVIEKLDFSNLEMSNPEDKLIAETRSGMIPWYDNYFLCSGYQEIKNINAPANKNRLVFFITKIAFN
jgi:hypothetical protein